MQNPIPEIVQTLRRIVTEPRHELSRWQIMVRFAYDLGRCGARQLRRDQAPRMAAALSFRTLFGLLPVMVVGSMLVRAIGGFDVFVESVREILIGLDLDRFTETEQVSAGEAVTVSLIDWIIDFVRQAETINIAAITWIGVIVLIYAAISLMTTIEGCFNAICRAPEGRPWSRKVPIYWTVITLAPAMIALNVFVDNRFNVFIDEVQWHWLAHSAPLIWNFTVTWLLMFAIYKLLPNTTVATQPAIIGAFVAATLIEILKTSMGAYLTGATSVRLVYSSLGFLPVFMFWLYIMWLVVLFGLEVVGTLQMLAGRSIDELEQNRKPTGLVDPASILTVMEIVAARFRGGTPTTPRQIADESGLPEATIGVMLDELAADGIVHRLDREDGAVTLARPPEQVTASTILEIGYELVDRTALVRRPAFVSALREGQRRIAAQATLAGLLPAEAAAVATDQVATD